MAIRRNLTIPFVEHKHVMASLCADVVGCAFVNSSMVSGYGGGAVGCTEEPHTPIDADAVV